LKVPILLRLTDQKPAEQMDQLMAAPLLRFIQMNLEVVLCFID
jgi:hypothetical protein